MKRACSAPWANERSSELDISGNSIACPLRITAATGCSLPGSIGKRSRRSSRSRASCWSAAATATSLIEPSGACRSITHRSPSRGTVSRATWLIVVGRSSDVTSTPPASTSRSVPTPLTPTPAPIATACDPGVAWLASARGSLRRTRCKTTSIAGLSRRGQASIRPRRGPGVSAAGNPPGARRARRPQGSRRVRRPRQAGRRP